MDYTPVSCDFYDLLEALAVRRIPTRIVYRAAGQLHQLEDALITDLQTRQKEEFMLLADGLSIRLDHLVSVHGHSLDGSCGI